MVANVGRNIAFTWDGSAVLGVRQKGLACDGAPIDITSDEDAGWRKLLEVAAQNEVTISLGGVTKTSVLKTAFFNGARTKAVVMTAPNGDTLTGTFYLANYKETMPYNDAVTFEAEIQSTGVVTFVAGV